MTSVLKQVAGIDVAQKELVVSLGRIGSSLEKDIYACKSFANKESGFKAMLVWVSKHSVNTTSVRYVMEATGVYHEKLAYYLSDNGYEVSIVLPNKISNHIRSLDIKTITDKTASRGICDFGLGTKLEDWQQPEKGFKTLRQLTRERGQLIAERTVAKNQLHAEQAEAYPNERSVARLKDRIGLFNSQEKEVKEEIDALIKQDAELTKRVRTITSIPGVGWLTAVTILAETNGFNLIRNKRQLVGYSGLDVKVKDSGTSVKSKPRISKRGNRYLRKAMYMPALAAIRSDKHFKAVFVRLVSKHGIKMKAAVAVQRKLLELVYTLWKTGERYDSRYLQVQSEEATS
ncbi:IS110 family RNA-guided transposase [Mucilaginibacter pedocola]|uniref:Transposase n=1 Tax=Mucilaginibacter pedocola TaxID=1792845 RepID=A0A1S9PGJ4_9SPHI|nr:IS110 family transposase [Mucilaginibacter pedocola]OOQ57491.1 transposase [Mucilaginibacter pedocola]OOQ58961.1 transposase [Mucilaginibacter pedocola]OOQ59003.1 transposase [Mucilaginibacter pedocola]OOQ59158.1 transposase [Mucilaginibacter pedocola]OOQ60080.1 transposase [Mucilaginibacter pedocola]